MVILNYEISIKIMLGSLPLCYLYKLAIKHKGRYWKIVMIIIVDILFLTQIQSLFIFI